MIAAAFSKKTASTVEVWTRPADWLPLPTVPAQGLVGLCAVPPEGAYVAILANTNVAAASGGRYVIDWGDGTQNEVNANATFEKVLDYSSYGNASSRGYRQAIITVTPKSGQNLTLLRLVSYTPRPYTTTPWLDIEINGTTALATLQLTNATGGPFHNLLERVKIHNLGNVTTLANFFQGCISLGEVILPSTTKITSMANMFNNCFSLLSVPTMDTSAVASMASMFVNCYKLKTVPVLDTAKVTTMASMFSGCVAMQSVQASFSTGLCSTLANMFSGCRSLKNAPAFTDTSKVTTIASIFHSCTELLAAPAMNCALVTSVYAAFYGCARLVSLPSYVFPKAITDARLFIAGATNLKSIANLTFSSTIGNIGEFANGAWSLSSVPALNVSTASNGATAFNRCYNLADVPVGFVQGAKASIDFRYCSLSAAAIDKIFNSLATIPSTQTTKPIIYIRGNPGTATCTASLATGKNWVVDTATV